jgi:hypothetical protein
MWAALSPEATEKIISLREARKHAINTHQYERARALAEEISQVKQRALDEAASSIRQSFRASVHSYLDRFAVSFQQMLDEAASAEDHMRLQYHKTFEALQANHRAKLLACEKTYADKREHEVLRRIPAVEKELELSQKAAAASQYEEAIRLRDGSRTTGQQDVEARLARVTEKFVADRGNLFSAFATEIQNLSERFLADVEKCRLKKEEAVAKEEANRDAQLIALLNKAQSKLSQVAFENPAKAAEEDLHAVLSERGCPIPSGIGGSAPPEKKSPKGRKSRTGELSVND